MATATRRAVATASPTPRPTPSPTPTLTPEQIARGHLKALASEWSATNSVHFVLQIDGATYLDVNEQIELDAAEGDLARPDRARAEATIKIGFFDRDVEIVVIGDDAYMTNFLSGDWERAPGGFGFNPALLFDNRRGLGPVLEGLDDPEVAGTEIIDGKRAHHMSGTVSQARVNHLVGGALEGGEIRVDVWMDSRSDQIIRLHLSETVEDDPVAWELHFSRHNQPVTIEAPDL